MVFHFGLYEIPNHESPVVEGRKRASKVACSRSGDTNVKGKENWT